MRIFIVEDDDSIREMLVECLADEGYSTTSARHGRAALEVLRETSVLPDLILLDMTMPVMNGPEFLQAQQQDTRLAQIPVIVLSGDRATDRQQRLLAGQASLAKPIDIDDLLSAVATYDTKE